MSDNLNFYLNSGVNYWTMSPRDQAGPKESSFTNINFVNAFGNAGVAKNISGFSINLFGVKPVINVQSNSFIGGNGSIDNPYVIE